jgi:hypothetical protein
MVSPKALACPQCGHPIASSSTYKRQKNASIGCTVIFLALAACAAWVISEGQKIQENEKTNPTCISDYTKCADNEQLVRLHETKERLSIKVACKIKAKEMAKYGEPELPFLAFSDFPAGRFFISSGSALLLEPDAKYHNRFNALENVRLKCVYDLKNDRASV